jgi:hypothetical protein
MWSVTSSLFLLDLCVSAALDAVKERVDVPWKKTSSDADISAVSTETDSVSTSSPSIVPPVDSLSADVDTTSSDAEPKLESYTRTLFWRHFNKALKEITPSSSEALGSLADLRKWNEEFGEGRKDRKRQQVWGKDRFGFTDKTEKVREEGRVASIGGAPSS